MLFFITLFQDVQQAQEQTSWTSPQSLEAENPKMAYSHIICHPMERDATLNDRLTVPYPPAVATTLPAHSKMKKELDLDNTDVIPFFKKKTYNVHMCV